MLKQLLRYLGYFLVTVLPFAGIILVETRFRNPWFEKSLTDIPLMQNKHRLKILLLGFAEVGSNATMVVLCALMINLSSKPAALYFWTSLSLVSYSAQLMKAIYAQPRPYWVSDEIESLKCLNGYGNPSSTLMTSTFAMLTLYLHKYYDIWTVRQRMSVFCTAYIIKMAMTVVIAISLILMSVAKVYEGANTWNQVLFAGLMGAAFAFVGHFRIKQWFYDLFPSQQHPQPSILKFGLLVILLLILFGSSVLVLLLKQNQDNYFLRSPAWHERMINSGCSAEQIEDRTQVLQWQHFQASQWLLVPFFSFFGQFTEWLFFNVNLSPWTWHLTKPLTTILRTTFTFLFVGAITSITAISGEYYWLVIAFLCFTGMAFLRVISIKMNFVNPDAVDKELWPKQESLSYQAEQTSDTLEMGEM